MWGIIPAAGAGSRMQPLAFSKELLPVGTRFDGKFRRPKAVSEYLIERMLRAGATSICMIISPGKSDIMEYYADGIDSAHFTYRVQRRPKGLCNAIFCALPLIKPDEIVIVGLPDTVWFPIDGLKLLPDGEFAFLLFPVESPELFDSVVVDDSGRVLNIQVKSSHPRSNWIWGAFKLTGRILRQLYDLWLIRQEKDEYIGTLVNAYMKNRGRVLGIRGGHCYVDVGTVNGYHEAIKLLATRDHN